MFKSCSVNLRVQDTTAITSQIKYVLLEDMVLMRSENEELAAALIPISIETPMLTFPLSGKSSESRV